MLKSESMNNFKLDKKQIEIPTLRCNVCDSDKVIVSADILEPNSSRLILICADCLINRHVTTVEIIERSELEHKA